MSKNQQPALRAIEGGGVPEPVWSQDFDDEIEQAFAREQWRRIVNELMATEKLAVVNAQQIRRLVIAYVMHERAFHYVSEQGPVTKSKKGNQVYNLWWTVMQQAGDTASQLEAELTISPRRRTNGGKANKGKPKASGASAYLHTQK